MARGKSTISYKRLARRARKVVRLTLPIMGRHRGLFVKGGLAAVIVVLCRLGLPWPLKMAVDRWIDGDAASTDLGAWHPAVLDPILVFGLGFVLLAVLLGMADFLTRLFFARFSVASVRDLRDTTIDSIRRGRLKVRKNSRGDLIARLVGDTARVKAGLKGFLVHVATNSLLLLGVAVVLFFISKGLGLVFAAAFLGILAVTIWGAARLFHLALRQRKKEGELAEQIQANLRSRKKHRRMKQTSRTSSRYEVAQTRTQGIVTWIAHGIFGLAVFAALWIGAAGLEAGAIGAGDMVAFMLYAILLRAPLVQLARQGSRTGKILGSAYRVVQIMDTANKKASKRAKKVELLAQRSAALQPAIGSLPGGALQQPTLRILFTGYAPVHFICFLPLYERLREVPGVEVFLSGGLRTKTKSGYVYDAPAMYRRFDVPDERILSVEQIRTQDFDVLFAGNTKLIEPRSVTTRIQIFHGISFRNKAVRAANMNCDHYFLVGPYMRRRFSEAGLMADDDGRAVTVGFMKTDALLNGSLDRSQLLQKTGLAGDRPVILYAPTGAKRNSLETMGEEVIARLVEDDRFDLLIKLHDHPKNRGTDWAQRLSRFEGAHCKLVRDPDVVPFLYLADLLISDASSVANEYALLDRPIIFLDTPELIEAARTAKGSMLDLNGWGRKGGTVVERPDDIAQAVETCLAQSEGGSEVRQAIAHDLFYNAGGATETAMAWLEANVLTRSTAA